MRHLFVFVSIMAGVVSTSLVAAINESSDKNSGSSMHSADATTVSVDPQSGLTVAPGYNLVVAHCSACHSPSLITQNAMSRERWLETIRWMQDTQKLWPLGDAEPAILDYLTLWYGPKKGARRPLLEPHLLPQK
ncbi:hypothetical protein [Alteromonas macleodii]|uniref:hypothetical protein n=1 Tax=Alteromonas macleodii TaxID=28108 RepID=UPI002FDFA40D